MLRSQDIKGFAFDLQDAMGSPVLTHAVEWANTISQEYRDLIPIERMIKMMIKEQKAGEAECLLYLSTASLVAPLPHDWHEIVMHLNCHVRERYFNHDCWEEFDAKKKLPLHQQYDLDRLANWLYEKRRKHLKARLKKPKIKVEKPGLKKQVDAMKEKIIIEQLKFDF